jgi:hypothetical protein
VRGGDCVYVGVDPATGATAWKSKGVKQRTHPVDVRADALLAQAGQGLERARLKELLAVGKAPGWDALTPPQRTLMTEALRDLDLALADMPDASLGADFSALTLALRDDLALPAAEADRAPSPAGTSATSRNSTHV